jgi:hypothetical protein
VRRSQATRNASDGNVGGDPSLQQSDGNSDDVVIRIQVSHVAGLNPRGHPSWCEDTEDLRQLVSFFRREIAGLTDSIFQVPTGRCAVKPMLVTLARLSVHKHGRRLSPLRQTYSRCYSARSVESTVDHYRPTFVRAVASHGNKVAGVTHDDFASPMFFASARRV